MIPGERDDDGRTHYEGCWLEHHDCAVAAVRYLRTWLYGYGSHEADCSREGDICECGYSVALAVFAE